VNRRRENSTCLLISNSQLYRTTYPQFLNENLTPFFGLYISDSICKRMNNCTLKLFAVSCLFYIIPILKLAQYKKQETRLRYSKQHLITLYLACPWMWVPVTTTWRVLRLRMEERPPIWRVAVNKLNKQPRTADKGWSSSMGVGRGANNPSPWQGMLRITHVEMLPLETKQSGDKLFPH
jgi:hypothetical protein